MKYSTFILVGVCVIIFLLQISIQGFTDNFVLKKELLFNEPWRLLTSIFLHSGIPHLLLNMFSLALFGIILENIIGTRRFLLIFFISGLIASLFSGFFYNNKFKEKKIKNKMYDGLIEKELDEWERKNKMR